MQAGGGAGAGKVAGEVAGEDAGGGATVAQGRIMAICSGGCMKRHMREIRGAGEGAKGSAGKRHAGAAGGEQARLEARLEARRQARVQAGANHVLH